MRVTRYQLPQEWDGWEHAKAQFVLQNSFMVFDPLEPGLQPYDPEEMYLRYTVERLVEVGLIRVVRSLTRVLCFRWVGGISPEDGWAVCKVLDEILPRMWYGETSKMSRRTQDMVDALSYVGKVFR